jgi:cytochrome oxidase Cu insertion factor (SCO1/SenC/PrrC family)
MARRSPRGGAIAAVGLVMLCIVLPARPAAAQNGSPREGSSLRFALTAASDGAAITEQTYRGKWVVVYFGYTSCPDVCPTTLVDIAQALEASARVPVRCRDCSLRSTRSAIRRAC